MKITQKNFELIVRMYNPVKICKPVTAKQYNDIIRAANPTWKDKNLHLREETNYVLITSQDEICLSSTIKSY